LTDEELKQVAGGQTLVGGGNGTVPPPSQNSQGNDNSQGNENQPGHTGPVVIRHVP
jgi:hypothetical protein